jgi:hypothetical protein
MNDYREVSAFFSFSMFWLIAFCSTQTAQQGADLDLDTYNHHLEPSQESFSLPPSRSIRVLSKVLILRGMSSRIRLSRMRCLSQRDYGVSALFFLRLSHK